MSHSSKRTADKIPNRLIREKSPYLLQHAYNPVDWHPWGDEAFEKARLENKPVFLSIGYSTCHWCHVMEKESFEDIEVARLMNETFISIKIDREERPDIDSVYMTVCQIMTRSGGWPLTLMLTPDKKPFFAATYIPKKSRFGRMGMLNLIPHVKKLWETDRDDIMNSADEITEALTRSSHTLLSDSIGEPVLKKAYEQLLQNFDEQYGGFGISPKFPSPHQLTFLLRYWKRTGDEKSLMMVNKTLQSMCQGGIYDHVGFGFHRYSTDQKWLLPHFEKMLYDQAMLAMVYTEAYQVTKNEAYRQTATEVFNYVMRDMTAPEGGFYSAEDADSEGEEGKFYLWEEKEIFRVIPEEEVGPILKVFNVKEEGNFTDEATGLKTGKNILYLGRSIDEIAAEIKISEEGLRKQIDSVRRKLLEARKQRIHPHKDDKILTDWNGLMIAALAKGAQVFDAPEYTEAAKRAVDFIFEKMSNPDKYLFHRYRDGETSIPAFLDDYTFLTWGLIELYEASFEVSYLQLALDLNNILIQKFWDNESSGFFFTAYDAEDVLLRKKENYDGAIPSGNSVAMLNLLRLSRMTANLEFEKKAEQISRLFSRSISSMPSAHTQMLSALDFALGPTCEIVIIGDLKAEDTKSMLRAHRSQFTPNKVVLFLPIGDEPSEITCIAGFTKGLSAIEGKTTAYVCKNFQCSLPTTDIGKMLMLLNRH